MPIETLWAVLGLAVPAGILLTYGVVVRNRWISAVAGWAAVSISILMVALVVRAVTVQ